MFGNSVSSPVLELHAYAAADAGLHALQRQPARESPADGRVPSHRPKGSDRTCINPVT